MSSRKVSLCKFVGTVTLGLMTGASYTLTSSTIPSLLELPSASSAAKIFRSLSATTSTNLNILTTISCSAFLLAFGLSPRGSRHPYLLYTSVLCLGARLTDYVAPILMSPPTSNNGAAAQKRAAAAQAHKDKAAAKRMEQSYEMLGSDAHSDEGSASVSDPEDEVNGEEVRAEIQTFVKTQLVQAIVSGVGFAMAVVGIWGDGVPAQAVVYQL
ncbi:autophagy-related protein 33 [Microdochium nivale]|nr:autophagy-related protein 33 [Microdochium nivale]